ncbi:MAG: hypothetical protein IJX77_02975 [Ruminococcus sp.]|nr:hypothetical protein [Ruminococcus sp.]
MNFIGEECFGCGRTFEESDDVVVCPDCGTPYHRDCYKEAGECVNHQLHESGGSWQRNAARKAAEAALAASENPAERICPRCHTANGHDAQCCLRCGMPFPENPASQSSQENDIPQNVFVFDGIDITNKYLGFNPEEKLSEDATLKEVSNFVNSNTFYYIPLFKKMKELGSKISLNFICLVFPAFYFANRKMWLWAVLTALITTMLNVPSLLYTIAEQGTGLPFMDEISNFIYDNKGIVMALTEICSFADWVLKICTCLFANWLYYRFSLKSVSKLKKFYGGPVSPAKLRSKGGVQPINIILIGLIQFALAAAVYFCVMFILMFIQQSGML